MSTRRTRSPLLLSASVTLAACTLALPGVAAAQSCQGAPGASAIQQYCEAVPRGDGGRDTSGGGSGSGGRGGSGVNAATSKVLAQAGRDGAAVQRLAGGGSGAGNGSTKRKGQGNGNGNGKQGSSGQGSAGAGAGAGSGSAGAGGSGSAASGPKDPSGSPLNAAKNAASTGPAAGQAVAWSIVGLSVLGAIAAVGLRRQRGTLPPVGEHADDTSSD
jgi:hypothetical protein